MSTKEPTGGQDGASSSASAREELLAHTTDIVAAHVSHNAIDAGDVPALIKSVFGALEALGNPDGAGASELKPAVSPKKSIQPDYLVCLEDGKKLKMLKRHLRTQYGLSPEEYRARWGLPADYPMVAPNYARHRQALAKQIGLGKRRRN